jgi:hypothetical protein
MGLRMLQSHHVSIIESKTVDNFRDQVIRFTRQLEFKTVNALVVIDHSPTSKGFYYVDNTPDAYRNIWRDKDLIRRDPVMQHCKNSGVPIIWDQDTYTSAGEGEMWEQGAEFGFKTGIGVTLHLSGDQHFLLGSIATHH